MNDATSAEQPIAPHQRYLVLTRMTIVALIVLILDFATKLLVSQTMELRETITLIPGFLGLHYLKNPGAAFGVGTGWPEWVRLPFFVTVFAIAVYVLYTFYKRCTPQQLGLQISLGLVAGGAIGNMADRLVHQRVTDFIDIYVRQYHWPCFNIADAAITIGVALLFYQVWILEGRREPMVENAPGAATAQKR